jgi:hypothetical protein
MSEILGYAFLSIIIGGFVVCLAGAAREASRGSRADENFDRLRGME